jgi:hypothetical protein
MDFNDIDEQLQLEKDTESLAKSLVGGATSYAIDNNIVSKIDNSGWGSIDGTVSFNPKIKTTSLDMDEIASEVLSRLSNTIDANGSMHIEKSVVFEETEAGKEITKKIERLENAIADLTKNFSTVVKKIDLFIQDFALPD